VGIQDKIEFIVKPFQPGIRAGVTGSSIKAAIYMSSSVIYLFTTKIYVG